MIDNKYLFLLAGFLLLPGYSLATERWYSEEQVNRGAKHYANHCAVCHKPNAEGAKEWSKTDKNGKYPPPPLNGTAHTWHHSMKVLSNTIRDGGIKLGGVMPAFKDKLDIQQRLDVIAFFQSKWEDKVYFAWEERNPLPKAKKKLKSVKESSKIAPKDPRLINLQKLSPGSTLTTPEKTPLKGIYQVRIGGQFAYVTEDGKYAIIGSLFNLEDGINLSQQAQARISVPLLEAFPDKNAILFKAEGKEKAVINVFTDTSCPYCKKFHIEVPLIQKAGVSVRYIPFPRGLGKGPGYMEMLSVWCSKDRVKAMNIAMGITSGKLEPGNCGAEKIMQSGFDLGRKVGVRGTPTSYLPDGSLISGYLPAKDILERISAK